MAKLILKYLGEDYLGIPVYRDTDGVLLKDTNCNRNNLGLCTVVDNDIDGEPNISISRIERYYKAEFVILDEETLPTAEEKSNYLMLSRLQSDCDVYLYDEPGERNPRRLWSNDVQKQIAEMKKIYNWFSEDKKPQWLTFNDILNYEKLMTEVE